MKTKFFHFAMVAVSVLAMTVFTSCNDKKDEPTDPTEQTNPSTPTKDTKAVAAIMQVHATFAPEMIEQCDISFDYYDANGVKKNEVVTTADWYKDIKSAGLPATLGLKWNLAVKPDLDASKYQHFTVNYRIRFSSVAVNAAGEEVSTPQVGEPNSIQGFAIAKREAVAESIMNNNPVKFVLKYDADGNCTKSTWE